MTSYSPSMLALHDMLRSQLELTREFLDVQKRMYANFSSDIKPGFKYTTLEDTKKVKNLLICYLLFYNIKFRPHFVNCLFSMTVSLQLYNDVQFSDRITSLLIIIGAFIFLIFSVY